MSSLRRVVLSALAASGTVVAMSVSAVPANAAVVAPSAIGAIVCQAPYICVQTQSANLLQCTAVVAAWADTTGFFGRFELVNTTSGIDSYYYSSPNKTFPAGGTNIKINVSIDSDQNTPYKAIAEKYASGKYSHIGSWLYFSINEECV
jgi:hypothetical protein